MMKNRLRENAKDKRVATLALCAAIFLSAFVFAQQPAAKSSSSHPSVSTRRSYPKEIRGYKVELANVEIKKQDGKGEDAKAERDADSLIQLGEPKVTSVTPLGISLEVPVTVAAIKQGGRVDFLTFEEMTVNGTTVTINEYHHSFDLPTREPVTLSEPVSIYISTPRALLGALGEWSQPKDVWPVTGRVYVFGRFKKFLFKFKRVVPVELNLSFRNPLKSKDKG
ncbi:MAG: hypothetical protein H0U54_02605 [Acidobacteria bacterium]|nr:hypothetical protein [Acidobacteriota bacterium]